MEGTSESNSILQLDETKDFLDHVNSTPKKIGHNKLQFEIDELQNEVERLKKLDIEKEMKLTLFKKNISTLQAQSQERLDEIGRLKNMIDNNPQTQEITNITKQLSDANSLNEKLQQQINDNELQIQQHATITKEFENVKDKFKEQLLTLESELEKLKEHIDTLTHEHNSSLDEVKTLKSQLDLKSNVSDNIVSELEELKQELIKYKSQNETLENELQEKQQNTTSLSLQLQEVEQQLHLQLEQQKPRDINAQKIASKSIAGRHRGLNRQTKRR